MVTPYFIYIQMVKKKRKQKRMKMRLLIDDGFELREISMFENKPNKFERRLRRKLNKKWKDLKKQIF